MMVTKLVDGSWFVMIDGGEYGLAVVNKCLIKIKNG